MVKTSCKDTKFNATECTRQHGWLHTGDMGRLDHKRLFLVERAKEVVVTSSGENIYLDDVEHTIGVIRLIRIHPCRCRYTWR